MKKIFKCDYCSKTGKKKKIKEHEKVCKHRPKESFYSQTNLPSQPKPKKNTCHLIPKTGDPYTNYCSECNGCIGDVTWIVPRYCKWCGLEIDYSYEE